MLLYHGRGYWSFPKGHIEKGEKSLKTAFREVAEETGIVSRDLALDENFKTNSNFFYTRGKTGIFRILIFYLAHAKVSKVNVSSEHEGYGWFLYRDATRLLKYENLKDMLKRSHQFINSRKK